MKNTHEIIGLKIKQLLQRPLPHIPAINEWNQLTRLVKIDERVPREECVLVSVPTFGTVRLAVGCSEVGDGVSIRTDLVAQGFPTLLLAIAQSLHLLETSGSVEAILWRESFEVSM